jgi:hypothetical protein
MMHSVVGTIVIYPKGTLTERISMTISGRILAEFLNAKLQIIWDHSVPYHAISLDNTPIVSFTYFQDKNYLYNPNMNQNDLVNNITGDVYSDMHLILETNSDLIHKDMRLAEYLTLKKKAYMHLLSNNLNGMISGQLNLFDLPASNKFCFIEDMVFSSKNKMLKSLPMLFDNQFPDAKNIELKRYLETLIYSKANLLICTSTTIPDVFIEASKMTMIPIICTNKNVKQSYSIKNISAVNFMEFPLVVYPNIESIKLYT